MSLCHIVYPELRCQWPLTHVGCNNDPTLFSYLFSTAYKLTTYFICNCCQYFLEFPLQYRKKIPHPPDDRACPNDFMLLGFFVHGN